jgi:spectinomycin phosphotransferase
MRTPPPATVTPEVLVTALASWTRTVHHLTYLPTGAGGYHWRADTDAGPHFLTVDDLDAKPWIAADRDPTFAGLTLAYATARALRDDGLTFVVAPLPTVEGALALRLDARHSLAVFPLVDGTPGAWGEPIAVDHRAALLEALAELHAPARAAASDLPRRRRHLPERGVLLDALAHLEERWTGGPRAEEAHRAFAAHAAATRQRLAHLDALATSLDRADPPVVVTHGEPHPGNLLATPDGLRLIDWDTVALAEPERDLWMLDAGPRSLDGYVAATGHPVDPAALELWRLAWTLSDLAWLTHSFRRGGPRSPDEHLGTYLALLEGATAMPYGGRPW